jgi:hypothetical protein
MPRAIRCVIVALMTTAHGPPRGMQVIHTQAFAHAAPHWKDRSVHAVIGRVKIKPGRADEALAMIRGTGVAMLAL